MIDEALLQFIWQHKLYKPANLTATSGESITVLHAGHINRNAGPDFTAARISIGNTTLVGNIELHLKTSDWQKHKHDNDPNYKNIILHVVYENDITAHNSDNVLLLELKSAIAEEVLIRYQAMSKEKTGIPCKHQHEQVPSLVKESWLNRMLAERWDEKLADWQVQLKNTNNDWRNLLYHRLAHNMGFNTNATPFLLLAQSTPLNILAKHRDSIEQLEALLFGQAGLLNNDKDNKYAEELKTEYTYLKTKYQLSPIAGHLWKFLRMRPANFPTVRIAQFASLIHTSEHLFSKITEAQTLEQLEPLFTRLTKNTLSLLPKNWDKHHSIILL
ncbi:MAG: DUF2851 family protein [Chitinophagia bacterium]|nr:DUF2851 family protein [Chitinophagia bacterium]